MLAADLSPAVAAQLADGLLVLHVGVVVFVVAGEVLFLFGGWRRWNWVRQRKLRLTHLLLMGFVTLQTWLGQLCPLTIWEQALRAQAGQDPYSGSFIAHWLGRLIFFDAPWWGFVLAYSGFLALVGFTWFWVRPHRP